MSPKKIDYKGICESLISTEELRWHQEEMESFNNPGGFAYWLFLFLGFVVPFMAILCGLIYICFR